MAEDEAHAPNPPDPARSFGFPTFANQFREKFAPALQALAGLREALNSIVQRSYKPIGRWQWVVLHLGMLNGVAMGELITLAANGYGHGAMKILRSMLETAVDAEFLRLSPGQRVAYFDWIDYERWRMYESVRTVAPDTYRLLGGAEIARARARYERVRPAFLQGRGTRKRWCHLDLRMEARDAGLESLYDLLNPLASRLLHRGAFSLLLHFDPKADDFRIDLPPSIAWVPQALIGGHSCLRQTVATLSAALEVEPRPSLAEVERAERLAWAPTAQQESGPLGRGDW